jgi:PAS domain S-box-containing protein
MFAFRKQFRLVAWIPFSLLFLSTSSGALGNADLPVRQPNQLQSIGIVALCAIQILLVAALVLNYLRRKKMESALSDTITQRKRDHGALRESDERFRVIADTSPVMIWMSDCSGGCTYFNQHWLEFTGQPIAEQLNDGWLRGVHSDDGQRCMETYLRAFHAREAFRMEYRLLRADGEYRWILDCGVPRYNPDHTFAGFIGSATDVNDSKKAEQTLRHLSGQLINAQEQERKYIARELHDDINQSLALLAIELEQLTANLPLDITERIRKTWKHALTISGDVQALSHRLHSSKLEYIGVLAAVRSYCNEYSEQQQIEIEFTHSGLPAEVPPDASLCIFRILQEALRNVVKHSHERYAEVDLCTHDGDLCLRVSDSGVGFDPALTNGNNGLGLISMRERLHLVGGQLTIHSRPKQGTELYVRVPIGNSMEKEKVIPFRKAA